MSDYRRPGYAKPTFRDAGGAVIAYGDRWPDRELDPNAYSACPHPERFAPLVVVARALIDYLAATYRVTVDHDRSERRNGVGVTEVARFMPSNPDGAPLSLTITSLPGVEVQAGASFSNLLPCGCDACDDDIDDLVEDLESDVFMVAEGRLTDRPDWQPWERR